MDNFRQYVKKTLEKHGLSKQFEVSYANSLNLLTSGMRARITVLNLRTDEFHKFCDAADELNKEGIVCNYRMMMGEVIP